MKPHVEKNDRKYVSHIIILLYTFLNFPNTHAYFFKQEKKENRKDRNRPDWGVWGEALERPLRDLARLPEL